MKPNRSFSAFCVAVSLIAPAVADTIYSNLLDTAIPTDFTGVTVTIAGGTLNPFFGGVGVANNNLLQPVRGATGNLDALSNLTIGSVVDVGSLISTGFGGSRTHLGTTFTAGTEGNIGFKLNGTNYGWMRVVFTGNTSGAVIKDWAYDNSGQAIVVGRVNQSAVSAGAQIVTLSPDTGESFVLGSALADTGGNTNSVLKTGAGTVTLAQPNTYTGGTIVNAGILKLGSATALGDSAGAVSVTGGAVLDVNGQTMTHTNALTLNGTGISSGGALDNSSATAATYAGLITLGSASSIVANNGDIILSNAGTITGSGFDLTLDGTATGCSIAGIIGTGAGSVIKNGTGTWTLSGVNTYSGNTTVTSGTLAVTGNSATTFADTSTVSIASGAVLNLPNAATDIVASLVINGSALPNGVYGASTPATTGYITGSGSIQIGVSGYAGWATANSGGDPANADTDLDGVSNGVEYFMNAPAGFTANPPIVTAGAVRTVTWPNGGNIPFGDYGTQFKVQTSTDLTAWTDVLSGDTSLNNTSGSVIYTLPTGAGEIFVRLVVTPN